VTETSSAPVTSTKVADEEGYQHDVQIHSYLLSYFPLNSTATQQSIVRELCGEDSSRKASPKVVEARNDLHRNYVKVWSHPAWRDKLLPWLWDSLFDRAVVLSDLVATGGEDEVAELKYASQLLMLTATHAAGSGGEEQLQKHM